MYKYSTHDSLLEYDGREFTVTITVRRYNPESDSLVVRILLYGIHALRAETATFPSGFDDKKILEISKQSFLGDLKYMTL